MKNVLMLISLIACGPSQQESIPLPKDFYSWTCKDYPDHTEVVVTTETCESTETGVHFLIAEAFLVNGLSYKRHLTEEPECSWSTSIVFIEEVCMSIEGVTLSAIVDESNYFFKE